MADAITEAAVSAAGLEERLELGAAELAALQSRHDGLAARLRTLENRSLVRAAVWLGGRDPSAEGRPPS
jgi:ubiquinone biosynthesis protein UbiJ